MSHPPTGRNLIRDYCLAHPQGVTVVAAAQATGMSAAYVHRVFSTHGHVVRREGFSGHGGCLAYFAWGQADIREPGRRAEPEVYMIDLLKVRLWGQGDMRPFP